MEFHLIGQFRFIEQCLGNAHAARVADSDDAGLRRQSD
jgi:hypothetical protein